MENLGQYFNGEPQNVGVQMGAVSNGLTDVDLDCAEAIALAPRFLPSTPAVFGRQGKPKITLSVHDDRRGSWRWTKAGSSSVITNAKILSNCVWVAAKVRSLYSPGSTHVSGELIQWATHGTPAPGSLPRYMMR